jgi:hypothetical protein
MNFAAPEIYTLLISGIRCQILCKQLSVIEYNKTQRNVNILCGNKTISTRLQLERGILSKV